METSPPRVPYDHRPPARPIPPTPPTGTDAALWQQVLAELQRLAEQQRRILELLETGATAA